MKTRRAPYRARLFILFSSLCFWREFRHQVRNGFELQPPLFTGSLIFQVSHTVEVAHIVKDKFSILQADEGTGGVSLTTLFDQMLNTQSCQPRRLDAVFHPRVDRNALHPWRVRPSGRDSRTSVPSLRPQSNAVWRPPIV